MPRVYLQNAVNVQMPATKKYPGGRVVSLNPGWVELDEEMASHPVLSRLIPENDHEQEMQEKLAQADEEYNKAIAEAEGKRQQVRSEVQSKRMDIMNKKSEEYNQRESEALAKGLSFNEDHPDPETRMYMSRTKPATQHAVPSAAFEQRPIAEENRKKDENMPSEEELKNKQQQNRQRLEDEGSPLGTDAEGTGIRSGHNPSSGTVARRASEESGDRTKTRG